MNDDSNPGVPLQTKLIGLAIVLAIAGITGYLVIARNRVRPLDHPYDVGDMELVDPGLITWHQVGAWPLEMEDVRCLAVAGDGTVLIGGDRRVVIRDHNGSMVREMALNRTPTAIAVADDGRILVAQRTRMAVYGDRKSVV
jgi:hypothetical protein